MRAIQVRQVGGPEAMELVDLPFLSLNRMKRSSGSSLGCELHRRLPPGRSLSSPVAVELWGKRQPG